MQLSYLPWTLTFPYLLDKLSLPSYLIVLHSILPTPDKTSPSRRQTFLSKSTIFEEEAFAIQNLRVRNGCNKNVKKIAYREFFFSNLQFVNETLLEEF